MLHFIIVAKRRPDLTPPAFRDYFARVHGPLAERLPGLLGYLRYFPAPDPARAPPRWDAVIHMSVADKGAMELAWAAPEGQAATADNTNLFDLAESSWSVVEAQAVIYTKGP